MSIPPPRVLLHSGRDRRRSIDAEDVYFLEAVGETTLVRLRSARRVRDVRSLGDLLKVLVGAGLVRVHRNHAVNVRHVLEVRRRSAQKDWEAKLEPPVNRVLPVGRTIGTCFREFSPARACGWAERAFSVPVECLGDPSQVRSAQLA